MRKLGAPARLEAQSLAWPAAREELQSYILEKHMHVAETCALRCIDTGLHPVSELKVPSASTAVMEDAAVRTCYSDPVVHASETALAIERANGMNEWSNTRCVKSVPLSSSMVPSTSTLAAAQAASVLAAAPLRVHHHPRRVRLRIRLPCVRSACWPSSAFGL